MTADQEIAFNKNIDRPVENHAVCGNDRPSEASMNFSVFFLTMQQSSEVSITGPVKEPEETVRAGSPAPAAAAPG